MNTLQRAAEKLGPALKCIGCVYYFGLIALIAASSPSTGNGPSAWDGYMPAVPGLPWLIHAAQAGAIILAGVVLARWTEKKKTSQAKES